MNYQEGHTYEQIDSYVERSGKCTKCEGGVDVEQRQYRDTTTGETGWWRVRSECNCTSEGYDPFKKAAAPAK